LLNLFAKLLSQIKLYGVISVNSMDVILCH